MEPKPLELGDAWTLRMQTLRPLQQGKGGSNAALFHALK